MSELLLFDAIFDRNVDEVRRLLESGANPNAFHSVYYAPLHFATMGAKHDIINVLQSFGAKIYPYS